MSKTKVITYTEVEWAHGMYCCSCGKMYEGTERIVVCHENDHFRKLDEERKKKEKNRY